MTIDPVTATLDSTPTIVFVLAVVWVVLSQLLTWIPRRDKRADP